MNADTLTQTYLKELLHYDPDTGLFTWTRRISNFVKAGDLAGGRNQRGYWKIMIKNKSYAAHRLAFLYMTGEFPAIDTDHINGDKADNRWINIRAVSTMENMQNQKMGKANTSGVVGVGLIANSPKWKAYIRVSGHYIHLGCFTDKEAAASARKDAEQRYGFHENHGRAV